MRKAERLAAAQAEQIGIAEADLYPAFSINGSLGYSAQFFPDLFRNTAFTGSVGPSFQWNILNYGRIVNNVRLQDARFQELVVTYQQTVLTASEEVENGLVVFLRSQRASRLLDESVVAAKEAVDIVITQYKQGAVDFNRYATIQQNLVTQQDQAAQARGNIAQGLIQTYQALGGGWELRLGGDQSRRRGPGRRRRPSLPTASSRSPCRLPTPPAAAAAGHAATAGRPATTATAAGHPTTAAVPRESSAFLEPGAVGSMAADPPAPSSYDAAKSPPNRRAVVLWLRRLRSGATHVVCREDGFPNPSFLWTD